MKTLTNLIFPTIILAITSCTSTSKMLLEQDVKINSLTRNEYTITEDKSAEATVTQYFGLWYDNKDVNHKKGIIKMSTGNLTIGNFNLNLTGALFATTLSIGTGFVLSNTNFDTWRFQSHSSMVKPRSNARYLPNGLAYGSGVIIGFGLNALIAPSPYKHAEKLAMFNFISDNKFDYIINPRFELTKKNSFFKKTATVRLTAKGMNIITDK